MSRHFAISFARSSGVFCVSPVIMPSPPALETAAASSAKPTKCMPPWMMGCLMPNSSVMRVFICFLPCACQNVRLPRTSSLPLFAERTDFQLEGPGALWLLVELPVGFRDGCRRHQQIRIIQRVRAQRLDAPLPYPFGIDPGIDDEMGDVDVLRPELARHRLRDRAQAELRAGECRIADTAAQARGGAGEEDVALAARQHQPRRLAAGEEAGIAGHLPDFSEHPLGGVEDREIDVGADVEDADFQRRMLVGVVEEGNDLLLLARIERSGVDLAAGRLDLLNQGFELGAVAAAGEDRETFGSEFLGNLAADIVAGADHCHGPIPLVQWTSPASSKVVARFAGALSAQRNRQLVLQN